jgi:hypothetical protein
MPLARIARLPLLILMKPALLRLIVMKPVVPPGLPKQPAPSPLRLLRLLLAVTGSLLLPPVHAQQPVRDAAAEREAYAQLPLCRLGADRRSLELEPCRTAPAQQPMPRRPVPQQDGHIGLRNTAPATTLPSAVLGPRPSSPTPPRPPAINPSAVNPSAVNPSTAYPATVQSPFVNPAPGAFSTPPPGPTRPSPATCSGGTCRDASGTTYSNPGNGVLTSPAGRPCTNQGGFVSCM